MEKRLKIILLIFVLTDLNQILAQTPINIYTPRGSGVTANTLPETMSYQDKLYWSDLTAYYYPQATEINPPSATSTYNCHSYAWNMSEGGLTCWIGLSLSDEDIYWTDQSYIETTEPYASKISYYEDDHSAIQTSSQGIYISKWGSMPLMQHSRNYGPSGYNMDYRKYYKLNPAIDGSTSALCDERTFTSNTAISGSTYTWTKNNSILDYVSGAGTTDYRVEPKSGERGNGWVGLQITTPSGEVATATNKTFWVSTPYYPTPYPAGLPAIEMGKFAYLDVMIASSPGADPSTGEWSSNMWIYTTEYQGQYGQFFSFTETEEAEFYVTTSNECGVSPTTVGYVHVGDYQGKAVQDDENSIVISPNPATDFINIELAEDPSGTYILEIFNSQSAKIISTSFTIKEKRIDISKLPKGIYYITVNNKGKILTGKFIKQ